MVRVVPLAVRFLPALLLWPGAAFAQATERGAIGGTIGDSAGVGIADVHISVPGLPVFGISAANGTFRVTNVAAGSRLVVARRIGFLPETVTVNVVVGRTADGSMRLEATPQHVATVLVTAVRSQYTGRLRGFQERRDRGTGGHFFTPEEIAQRRPRVVTDLIRTLPGARVIMQGGTRVVTFRDLRCLPLVWVDGAPATTGYLDPDLFTPSSLAGIEVYYGASTIPSELQWVRNRASCGVIAIWTKVPEPRRATTPRKVTAEDLSLLVASLFVVHGGSGRDPGRARQRLSPRPRVSRGRPPRGARRPRRRRVHCRVQRPGGHGLLRRRPLHRPAVHRIGAQGGGEREVPSGAPRGENGPAARPAAVHVHDPEIARVALKPSFQERDGSLAP